MKTIKSLIVFGTRPEAIKLVPLIKEIENREEIENVVCVTAQHREMLDQVLKKFDIKPDYDLNIMKANQKLSGITVRAIEGIENVIKEVNPDIVLVHGDTTTTMTGALVSFYNKVLLGHIEAGLRTYNKYSPFPEEINRQITSVLADIHFAPTIESKLNLLKEGIGEEKIFVTGNTAIDTLRYTVREDYKNDLLNWVGNSKLILLTAHRRENLGKNMENMFKAIKRIVDEFENVKVIYPVHLNPLVQSVASNVLKGHKRIKLISPLDVFDFHNIIARAYIVLTDSGGIQEEAPALGKPVLVLRDTTERTEGIESGTLKLAGIKEKNIYRLTKQLLINKEEYFKMSNSLNPYGDGFACKRIVDIIIKYFNK